MRTESAANQRVTYIRRLTLLIVALCAVIGFSATSSHILHANAMEQDGGSQPSLRTADNKSHDDKSSLLCVEPGDTLWGIAKKYGPVDVGVKTYVQQIIEYNGLDNANLQVGQVIRLP